MLSRILMSQFYLTCNSASTNASGAEISRKVTDTKHSRIVTCAKKSRKLSGAELNMNVIGVE